MENITIERAKETAMQMLMFHHKLKLDAYDKVLYEIAEELELGMITETDKKRLDIQVVLLQTEGYLAGYGW